MALGCVLARPLEPASRTNVKTEMRPVSRAGASRHPVTMVDTVAY